ncbi:hypothetical protein DEU56DRAFT_872983 [Suillus clintonianus]|uniref:uncharacterized protein n=1 Tax=Suillus clintonianus TaxID=1904413 RepID=UPI001B87A7C4|nr:uncharacterized protein DEU56DRAFT_872983 [Suillus clintonianus]KAG2125960.1 hypothetical protein DEU56DRAFT_872983 [Suillus clintonianus]
MYRCQDCHGGELMCPTCAVHIHERQPLHRIECWNGTSFQITTLKTLGARFQLGHPIGVQCINLIPAFNDDFVILDCNGIHEVGLDFCACQSAQPHIIQLLCGHLFPATTSDPKSAATFRVLEYFQMLSFESKGSAWEFYNTVVRLTENIGTHVPKNHYDSLRWMICEWCFVMQMKHCGQGHHLGGIKATEAGACAVLCPACPHPNKNLPVGWENSPPEFQFLYVMFIAIDANFRLVRRNVSSDAVDPGLNHGYTFFVEETGYKGFLASCNRVGNAQEKSTCSSHSAVNLADTRASRGLAATGVGTVDCARHNFKYINMDYLFFSSMQSSHDIHVLNISYDIACQWNKNLWSHMSAFPHKYRIDHDNKLVTFLVPKFHLPAHITSCQTRFSFNFIKGVGRTDGEAPERGWADINPIATSTCEMGPGSSRDTIDDHFNNWNWKKAAIPEAEECAGDLKEFEAALDADQLAGWRKEIEMWESDRSLTNLFEVKARTTVTQAAMHLALSKAEVEEIECVIAHAASCRRRVEFEVKTIRQHATDAQKVKILQHINSLHLQLDIPSEDKAHKINLFLPSSLPPTFPCDDCLLKYEWDLRQAQANNALNDLHTVINMTYHLYKYKYAFIRAKYTAARDALRRILKPLDRRKDAVPLKHDEGKTVGQQNISWIWKVAGVSNNQEEGLQDLLRVEWCKVQARAHRWEEEVQLLREEVCCVLAFLEWQAGWWDAQGSQHQFGSSAFTEGAVAYAHHQAMLCRSMSARFRLLWEAIPS